MNAIAASLAPQFNLVNYSTLLKRYYLFTIKRSDQVAAAGLSALVQSLKKLAGDLKGQLSGKLPSSSARSISNSFFYLHKIADHLNFKADEDVASALAALQQ